MTRAFDPGQPSRFWKFICPLLFLCAAETRCASKPERPTPAPQAVRARDKTYGQTHPMAQAALERCETVCRARLNEFRADADQNGTAFTVTVESSYGENDVDFRYVFRSPSQTLTVKSHYDRAIASEETGEGQCELKKLANH